MYQYSLGKGRWFGWSKLEPQQNEKKKTLISIEILTRSSVEVNSWVDRQESLIPSKQKKFKTNNCLSERISHSEASNTRKCVHKFKIENITQLSMIHH